ncbi:hypothetical protein FHR51_002520 [Xanthomonas arboricola]|uniref:hypothetical protein n=1 Tax=Xanthomonas cannabis TaxID=1885674 RepID=UPI00161CFE79|nr:hypothetical protein [Xanthomonas cannabis]MBB3806368.1 hypothetical protein [Xanthomonas cannabis]
MNEQFGNSEQLLGNVAGSGAVLIEVTDPWRGLYSAERLIANGDGDLYHPDLPSWPDDREDALDKLVRAQGFDFQIVAGEFTEEAMEDGCELYWQEMRAWNPEAPAGDWRLAWKGDTEDGPYAWFVRPMALRPDASAAEQMHAQLLNMLGAETHESAAAQIGRLMGADIAARPPVATVIGRDAWDRIAVMWHSPNTIALGTKLYTAPPAPAAVPVDVLLASDHSGMRVDYSGLIRQTRGALTRGGRDPALAEMQRQLAGHLEQLGKRWYAGDTSVVDELLQLYCIDPIARAGLKATHPKPAAAKDGDA